MPLEMDQTASRSFPTLLWQTAASSSIQQNTCPHIALKIGALQTFKAAEKKTAEAGAGAELSRSTNSVSSKRNDHLGLPYGVLQRCDQFGGAPPALAVWP